MKKIELNESQKLYVLYYDEGVSTLGFDVVMDQATEIARRLERPEAAPLPEERGTLEAYRKWEALIEEAKRVDIGTYFPPSTPKKVEQVLTRAIKRAQDLRIFYGDPETGRDDLSTYGVMGTVGRSCGPALKVPVITPDDTPFGDPISADRIVKIVDIETGKVLYRHRSYHVGKLTIEESSMPGYKAELRRDNEVVARFKKFVDAYRLSGFLMGLTCRDLREMAA